MLRTLIGTMLVGLYCGDATAAEHGSRWWAFGRRSDTTVTQPPHAGPASGISTSQPVEQQAPVPEYATDAEPERRWMIDSPLAKVSWPRIHLPELPKPPVSRPQFLPEQSQVDEARNAWVDKTPTRPEPSPLQAVTDGARRVSDSTRAAWRKTVDAFTPREASPSNSSRVARRDARPPFWKRMFAAEEQQPQGPQTVTEWMAQERLDP